jgi:hypothetical protein
MAIVARANLNSSNEFQNRLPRHTSLVPDPRTEEVLILCSIIWESVLRWCVLHIRCSIVQVEVLEVFHESKGFSSTLTRAKFEELSKHELSSQAFRS